MKKGSSIFLLCLVIVLALPERSGALCETGDSYALELSSTNLFAGTWQTGLFLSADNGWVWTPANSGLPEKLYIRFIKANGKRLFVGSDQGMFLSDDNGANWTPVDLGFKGEFWKGDLVRSGKDLFAFAGDRVLRSSDNGASWKAISSFWSRPDKEVFSREFPFDRAVAIGPNLVASIYEFGGVVLSTDKGKSWRFANKGLQITPELDMCYTIKCFVASGPNLIAGGLPGIFLSKDNGASWSPATGWPSYALDVGSLAVIDEHIYAGTSVYGSPEGGHIFLSTDHGANWSAVDSGLPVNAVDVDALAVSGSFILAGTRGRGVYISSNKGKTWNPLNSGLPEGTRVECFVLQGNVLFAGTYRAGVWRLPLTGLSKAER